MAEGSELLSGNDGYDNNNELLFEEVCLEGVEKSVSIPQQHDEVGCQREAGGAPLKDVSVRESVCIFIWLSVLAFLK